MITTTNGQSRAYIRRLPRGQIRICPFFVAVSAMVREGNNTAVTS